ncbi:4-hydroxy-tetrahydrodipicolinate synthase [Thalassobacillus cyri]|uniref:4-hydroxy-tetrahydrodipicolinate synthase n=1 Tax=Thalassobacillus cyri TaxID=571932 RepID=A0A1H3VXM4_9BACI|nr:dihydrodipicolinate synthase family protein [Thalassobacillus cyri]SDZ78798.1 4-hydroxy-tetrahydrodipicolinate synthase [Thalassobacillus cyri]
MKPFNVAIPTPFFRDEQLNVDGFKTIMNHLKENGVESIIISGTTGEQHSMSIEERLQIIDYFNEQDFKDMELIFGVAATRLKDAERLVKKLENSVFDGILLGFPPYIKPTQTQAVYYAGKLLSLTTKEVILYNNPPRTGFDLSTESFRELLSSHSNIAGLKDGGDKRRHADIELPDNFILYAAGDMQADQQIKDGCNGLSSMVGNIYPQEMKSMLSDLCKNKGSRYEDYKRLIDEATERPLIETIKNHYNKLGIEAGICRSPL